MAPSPVDDEEDDYLGDLSRFLQPHDLVPSKSEPSVQHASNAPKKKLSWQEKRQFKHEKENKIEEEHRLEGLGSAISSSNIGYKMLQQMGYCPGAALGKHGQGSLEPINLDVKRSRTGLGRDTMEKVEKDRKAKLAGLRLERKRRKNEDLRLEFQERRKSSWQSRKLASDYRKAFVALNQLEETHSKKSGSPSGVAELNSEDKTFHSEIEELQDENVGNEQAEEDDSEEDITQEALQELLGRLRTEYFYCLYCGCQYETANSLVATCPGPEEDDH